LKKPVGGHAHFCMSIYFRQGVLIAHLTKKDFVRAFIAHLTKKKLKKIVFVKIIENILSVVVTSPLFKP
jgi:hypothetical protein